MYVSRKLIVHNKEHDEPLKDVEVFGLGRVVALVAEPGAGKTRFTQALAHNPRVQRLSALAFIAQEPLKLEVSAHSILILDGVDEIASKRWGDGILLILKHLNELGRPRVILTCRGAEWEGARNRLLFQEYYNEEPIETSFAPFTDEQLTSLVKQFNPQIDAEGFIASARERDLEEFLKNPESLKLLLHSIQDGQWPRTRTALFENAAIASVRETNPAHLTVENAGDAESLIDAAGEIFASTLMSGVDGIDTIQGDQKLYAGVGAFGFERRELFLSTANTRLFSSEGGSRLRPSHRMVAEFLAARWLSKQLEKEAISERRLAAVIAPNGQVRTDLRGLHAWIGSLSPPAFRIDAISRDPYGVLRYGDPVHFSNPEKHQLLESLKTLAEDDPYFMAAEGWARPLILDFFDEGIRSEIAQILSSRSSNHQLVSLLLSAINGSKFSSSISEELLEVVLDETRSYGQRFEAVEILGETQELDRPNLVRVLGHRHTEDSARLSLDVVASCGGNGLQPTEIANALFDAMVSKSGDRDADLSNIDHRLSRKLKRDHLDPVLDHLSSRMRHMCSGNKRHRCECMRAVSPSVLRLVERRASDSQEPPTADQLWRWLRNTYTRSHSLNKTESLQALLSNEDKRRNTNIASFLPKRLPARARRRVEGGLKCLQTWIYHVAVLRSDVLENLGLHTRPGEKDMLRRHLQTHAMHDAEFESSPWMALFRIQEDMPYILPTIADVVFHLQKAALNAASHAEASLWEDLVRWAYHDPYVRALAATQARRNLNLKSLWRKIDTHPELSDFERKLEKKEQERTLEKDRKRAARICQFEKDRAEISKGKHLGWLNDIAGAFFNHFIDINGKSPEDRVADLVGHDGVSDAMQGLRASLARKDLPTLEQIVTAGIEGKEWNTTKTVCAGLIIHLHSSGSLSDLEYSMLEAMCADRYFDLHFEGYEEERFKIESFVFSNNSRHESFARRTIEPFLSANKESVRILERLSNDERFQPCIGILSCEWLERFPHCLLGVRQRLFETSVAFGDTEKVVNTVRNQCKQLEILERNGKAEHANPADRKFWIGAAFLLDFEQHYSLISAFAQEGKNRLWLFQNMLFPSLRNQNQYWPRPTIQQCLLLIKSFAPLWPPVSHPRGTWSGSTNPWDASEFLLRTCQTLGESDSPTIGDELDALTSDSRLVRYHDHLKHIRASWLKRRQEVTTEVPSFSIIRNILTNQNPKAVSDLQAFALDVFDWLQADIRHGDTKGWTRFWAARKPLPENDCRDHILDRIRHKFLAVNVQLRPECRMPDDKRADIVASLVLNGETFDLPIEVKGQWHSEVWSAAIEQLESRYTRYVNARGYGIYLVLWFGQLPGKNLPKHPAGQPLPTSPKELRHLLLSSMPVSIREQIQVVVLDLSQP